MGSGEPSWFAHVFIVEAAKAGGHHAAAAEATDGAERAASADCDGCGDGFQNSYARGDTASVEQHRFHGFGNAVAFNFRRAVLCHDADNNAADHRNDDYHPAEMVTLCAGEIPRPAMKEENICEQPDQFIESESNDATHQSNGSGEE